jgi:hypothetical protein
LTVAGLVGLLLALAFDWRVGPTGSVFQMGYPDAWLVVEREWTPSSSGAGATDFRTESRFHFLRWSFGALVASNCALIGAVRLGRRTPTDA